jgi:hypothetical protein
MKDMLPLKIYNKDGKLNILITNTKLTKTISIYKYNGENVDKHSFTYANEGFEMKSWQAYYELLIETEEGVKEFVNISKNTLEHCQLLEGGEVIKTTVNLNSGNVYEKRTKYFEGDVYELENVNNKLSDFKFRLKENKIQEYLKKIKYGK